jgi:hypothetical protein
MNSPALHPPTSSRSSATSKGKSATLAVISAPSNYPISSNGIASRRTSTSAAFGSARSRRPRRQPCSRQPVCPQNKSAADNGRGCNYAKSKTNSAKAPPEPVAHAPHQPLTLTLMELEPSVLENLQDA